MHFASAEMSFEQAMQAADMACYMAKEKGRNRVHVYAPDDTDMAERAGEMGWVQRLHRALERDRFCLYAQSIAPLRNEDSVAHFEILLRLRDDGGSLVPPASFIPAAERFGLMPLLDRWVVKHALASLGEHRAGAFCQCGDELRAGHAGSRHGLLHGQREGPQPRARLCA